MNKLKIAAISLSVVAAAVLVACGGGGGTSSTAQAQQAAVQTYITDNLATEYAKVFVTIQKITVLDGAGAEVTLVDATASPVVVNLSSLASVAQFMSTVSIPAGIYTGINVTLGNAVQLVSLDGASTTEAKFSAAGTDFVWRVRNVSLDTASGQFVMDFNLAKFTYDATTGLVTPVMDLPRPDDAFKKFTSQRAEARGTVVAVDATTNTVTVNDPVLGSGIVVSLATDAVIQSEADGKVLTLADLVVGTRVEVKGTVTPGATTTDPVTITATVIEVEPASTASHLARLRGDGTVTTVNGNLVTVNLLDANFLPGSSSLVLDITTAKFAHGLSADVLVGATVYFRGTASAAGSASQITVANMDVRGAASERERKSHPMASFSGLDGAVIALNADGSFTVNATKTMGNAAGPGAYTVDPSKANYLQGSAGAACVVVGATVDVLGALTGTTLAAKFISVQGCGGQKHSR